MPRTPEGHRFRCSHMAQCITLQIFYVKHSEQGWKNKFQLENVTLQLHLVSSGLVSVPGEQRHSWRYSRGAGRTACTKTYRTAMKETLKKNDLMALCFFHVQGDTESQKKPLRPLMSTFISYDGMNCSGGIDKENSSWRTSDSCCTEANMLRR